MAGNGNFGAWTRWVIGLLAGLILGALAVQGAAVMENRADIATNTACIELIRERLKDIDRKLDTLMDRVAPSR